MAEGSIERAENLLLNTQNEFSTLWTELTSKKLAVADILAKSRLTTKDRETALEAVTIITETAMRSFRKDPGKYADVIEAMSKSKKYLELNANPANVMDNLFMYINTKVIR